MASSIDQFCAKYSKILADNSQVAENEKCVIWGGRTELSKHYVFGVINVTFPLPLANRRKMNVARLSKMISLRNINIDRRFDASHLCHNSLCINPEHINLELHSVNNKRHTCVSIKKCIHHGLEPDCLIEYKL